MKWALCVAILLLCLILFRSVSLSEFDAAEDAAENYKKNIIGIFFKYGKGGPVDISRLKDDESANMINEFVGMYNGYQKITGGQAITVAEGQDKFPVIWLNEYNALFTSE